jgi:hypothetical protein
MMRQLQLVQSMPHRPRLSCPYSLARCSGRTSRLTFCSAPAALPHTASQRSDSSAISGAMPCSRRMMRIVSASLLMLCSAPTARVFTWGTAPKGVEWFTAWWCWQLLCLIASSVALQDCVGYSLLPFV